MVKGVLSLLLLRAVRWTLKKLFYVPVFSIAMTNSPLNNFFYCVFTSGPGSFA